jgi:hypothetical protein
VSVTPGKPPKRGRQPAALAGFLVIQTVAAVFFVGDALGDMIADGRSIVSIFEVIVALALFLGMIFGGWELRRTLERMRAQEAALAVASGALAEVIRAQFAALFVQDLLGNSLVALNPASAA